MHFYLFPYWKINALFLVNVRVIATRSDVSEWCVTSLVKKYGSFFPFPAVSFYVFIVEHRVSNVNFRVTWFCSYSRVLSKIYDLILVFIC